MEGYRPHRLEGAARQGCSSGLQGLSQAETGHNSLHRCTGRFFLLQRSGENIGALFFVSFPAPQVEAAAPPCCGSELGQKHTRNQLEKKVHSQLRKLEGTSALGFVSLRSPPLRMWKVN